MIVGRVGDGEEGVDSVAGFSLDSVSVALYRAHVRAGKIAECGNMENVNTLKE